MAPPHLPHLPESAFDSLGLDSNAVRILTSSPPAAPANVAAPNVLNAEPSPARDLSPNESAITLYAEVLLHIRTITLYASLATNKDRTTKAKFRTDGYDITIAHEGEAATIRLPVKAKGDKNEAALELPASPKSKELNLRLQIEEEPGSDLFRGIHAEERTANIVPWDGASLNTIKTVQAVCKSCQHVLVEAGVVKEWRDLPNENWAEMMDFWHCHKPDEHHLHDHSHHETVAKKGYAAGTRLRAAKGTGFVDLASLLLQEQDCVGVQLHTSRSAPHNSLVCRHCDTILGTIDESADGWRVWKWSIDIFSPNPPSSPPSQKQSRSTSSSCTPQKWISARLLYLIENTALRKFHIHPDNPSPSPSCSAAATSVPSLLVWVFTPDLYFSYSLRARALRRNAPTRAMKVFYKRQTWSPPKPGDAESASVEDVPFPAGLWEELVGALEGSQHVLPESARRFQGWEVGLLERFDVGDIADAAANGAGEGAAGGAGSSDEQRKENGGTREEQQEGKRNPGKQEN